MSQFFRGEYRVKTAQRPLAQIPSRLQSFAKSRFLLRSAFFFCPQRPAFLLSGILPQCTISRKPGEQSKNPPCRFKASGDWHPWQYFLWHAWIPDQLLKGQVCCKGFGSVDLSQVKLNIKAGACLCTVIDNIRDGQNFICPLKNIARRRKVILQKVVVNLLGDLKSGFRQCAHIFLLCPTLDIKIGYLQAGNSSNGIARRLNISPNRILYHIIISVRTDI